MLARCDFWDCKPRYVLVLCLTSLYKEIWDFWRDPFVKIQMVSQSKCCLSNEEEQIPPSLICFFTG